VPTSLSTQLLIYKLAALAVGLVTIVLGYSLFTKGIFGPLANLEASKGGATMNLQNAGPGIFFALFGAAIIGFAVFKGMRFKSSKSSDSDNDRFATNEVAVRAEYENVLNSVNRLVRDGYVTDNQVLLLRYNLAALANAILGDKEMAKAILGDKKEVVEEKEKESFEGYASPPG